MFSSRKNEDTEAVNRRIHNTMV